jgi:ribosome maturation factor RimP
MEWAYGPFFVSGEHSPEWGMQQDPLHISELLEPAVRSLGYELVGVEYRSGGQGGGLLRVYIDSEQGITVDDCQTVSYQVSGVLDVEDPIPGHYTLEVSSPGNDRLLFKPQDYERFTGSLVKVRLSLPLEGRRKFKGRLQGLEGGNVVIEQDGEPVSLPLNQIEQARLVPEY